MSVRTQRVETRTVIREAHGGRLEEHRSSLGTIPVIFVSGEPEQIGLQYGTLLGESIAANLAQSIDLFATMGFPHACVQMILLRAWERMAPFVADRHKAEIAAIARGAQGAGVNLDQAGIEALMAVTNLDMYRREERLLELLTPEEAATITGALEPGPPVKSCTTFAAWGSRTVDGKMYALRNLDWISQTGMHRMRLVSVYQPEGAIPFVTAGYAGSIGALAGMNAKGIALGEVGAFSASEELDGTPWVLMAREILEKATCLHDGIEIVRGSKHTMGLNYVIADGDPEGFGTAAFQPDAAAFETHHTACEVFFANDPKEREAVWQSEDGTRVPFGLPMEDAVMRADTAFAESTRGAQVADNGPADPEGDGNPLKGSSYVECHRPMHDMMRAYETGSAYTFPVRNTKVIEAGEPRLLGIEEALTIGATVAHNTESLVDDDWNVMSVVYAPTDLECFVSFEHEHEDGHWTNAPDTGYWHFTLDELLQ